MRNVMLAAFVALPLCCAAQFNKWTIFTNGTGAYSYSKYTGSNNSSDKSMTLTPSIGVFVFNRCVAGVEFNYLYAKDESSTVLLLTSQNVYANRETTRSRAYALGPYVRYYPVAKLFVQGGYFWGGTKQENVADTYATGTGNLPDLPTQPSRTHTEQRSNVSLNGFSVGPGYSFFIDGNKKVAIDLSIVYQHYSAEGNGYNGFSVGLGLSGFLRRQVE
ncbi:hypothetical protein [Ohtaekwangia sp.]|uniref:hypothetical protein n=1 Tax=Ohtaekwangia sp. TaxID=2066019 RepID=UPI002FDDE61D